MTPNLEMFKDSSFPRPQSRPHFHGKFYAICIFSHSWTWIKFPVAEHSTCHLASTRNWGGKQMAYENKIDRFFPGWCQIILRHRFSQFQFTQNFHLNLSAVYSNQNQDQKKTAKNNHFMIFHGKIWASLPFDRQNEWSGPAKASIANISWLFGQLELAPLNSSRPSYDVEKPMYVLMHAYIGSTPHPVTGANEGL